MVIKDNENDFAKLENKGRIENNWKTWIKTGRWIKKTKLQRRKKQEKET